MTVNHATIELIKQFEGFRPVAYKCPAGIWTTGYGTTAAAGVGITPKAGMTISEAAATAALQMAVDKFAAAIRPGIKAPINENEFGAFVSLAYNIGPGAFLGSTALRKFNAGDKAGAGEAMMLWDKAGGKVLRGLQNRRIAERKLFLTPVAASAAPAPTPAAPKPPLGLWGVLSALWAAILAR